MTSVAAALERPFRPFSSHSLCRDSAPTPDWQITQIANRTCQIEIWLSRRSISRIKLMKCDATESQSRITRINHSWRTERSKWTVRSSLARFYLFIFGLGFMCARDRMRASDRRECAPSTARRSGRWTAKYCCSCESAHSGVSVSVSVPVPATRSKWIEWQSACHVLGCISFSFISVFSIKWLKQCKNVFFIMSVPSSSSSSSFITLWIVNSRHFQFSRRSLPPSRLPFHHRFSIFASRSSPNLYCGRLSRPVGQRCAFFASRAHRLPDSAIFSAEKEGHEEREPYKSFIINCVESFACLIAAWSRWIKEICETNTYIRIKLINGCEMSIKITI